MSRRRPEVLTTAFHALDPRDCTCADGACVAAAIERVSAIAAPGVARCDGDGAERPRAEDDVAVAAAARRGGA